VNLYTKHPCFKQASAHQQKEQLEGFRRAIEKQFGLHPQKRRKPRTSNSAGSVGVGSVAQGSSNEASLTYLPRLVGPHQSNSMGTLEGVDDSMYGAYEAPSMLNAQPYTLLAYVDSMFSQPEMARDWDTGNF
jgi:hypothetical protein